MNPIPINIAVEDVLSEVVARRLLAHSPHAYAIGTVFNRGGFGYLKKTIGGWNSAAKGIPFLLLTDLDRSPCASALLAEWLPQARHPNLLARVAVREVESWLLADRLNFANFLKISPSRMPASPDHLLDPKAMLIGLARQSSLATLKKRLVPKVGTSAKQGRDYNACLSEFVFSKWDITEAAKRSDSLLRCINRINAFEPLWA